MSLIPMNLNKAQFSVTDANGNSLTTTPYLKFESAFEHLKKAGLQQRDREFWLHILRPGSGWQRILSSKDVS